MMANKLQRQKALETLGIYFAEKGKVLSVREYVDAKDRPILHSNIRRIFRSYSRMVEMLKRYEPDLFDLAEPRQAEQEPTQEPPQEPTQEPVQEDDPIARARAAMEQMNED